jgi:hypothetical protein
MTSPLTTIPISQISTPHLILVCCHAIYLSGPSHVDSSWLLAPFQTSESATFTSHAHAGLILLSQNPQSLLVFSGSKTNPGIDKSEAQSYLELCIENDFFGLPGFRDGEELKNRIVLEEQALDSFANLLFGMLVFWRSKGEWPKKITIVTHAFKQRRFEEFHVPAIHFDSKNVTIHGIDPDYFMNSNPSFDAARAEQVRVGEQERGIKPWHLNPLGDGPLLRQKRKMRNPWKTNQVWFTDMGERQASKVKSKGIEWIDEKGEAVVEEVLDEVKQPWEVGA